MRPDRFTAPCRSTAKVRNWNVFSIHHSIKMTADNSTFGSFKVLHSHSFSLSSQQLSQTDSIDYYYQS